MHIHELFSNSFSIIHSDFPLPGIHHSDGLPAQSKAIFTWLDLLVDPDQVGSVRQIGIVQP